MNPTIATDGDDVGPDDATDVAGVRQKVAIIVLIAHAIGLNVTGVMGTIGTTAGFSLGGAGIGLYLGGILSIPWMAVLGGVVWFKADFIDTHPLVFSTVGPLLVVGSWASIAGDAFLGEVAVLAGTSALSYLLIRCACPLTSHRD